MSLKDIAYTKIAVTELEALRAEIERLRRENDALYDMIRGMKINLSRMLEARGAKSVQNPETWEIT